MHPEQKHGELNHEIPPGYVHWAERNSSYLEDHRYLASLSTKDWNELHRDPERCFSLIRGALLEEEYARYNPGETPLPETKILFMISNNLRDEINLDETRVRKKESRWAKASEHDELIAALSQFIEHYPGIPAHKVYSEMADVFWNLIQLTSTDQDFHQVYESLVHKISNSANLSKGQVGILVITKYATRLYRHQGKTNHEIEDAQIEQLRFGVPDDTGNLVKLVPDIDEAKASIVFDVMQKAVKPLLVSRFEQMKSLKTLNTILEEQKHSPPTR